MYWQTHVSCALPRAIEMLDRDLDHFELVSMMRMMHRLRVAMCAMHLLCGLCDQLLNFEPLLGTFCGLAKQPGC